MSTLRTLYRFAAAVGCASLMNGIALSPVTAEPVAKQPQQVAGYYRMNMGDLEVTALYDGYVRLDPEWLQGISTESLDSLLEAMFIDAESGIQTAVNGYLINTGSNLILVDAGAAACFGPTMGFLKENLQASGYTAEQVDTVLLTHLHPDHSCGLADAEGAAVFPNATVHIPQAEAEFWLDTSLDDVAEADQPFFNMARAAVAPYVEEKLQRFKTDILPGVESVPSHGHTPGHTGYLFRAGDDNLMVWGDVLHNHAVQFKHPEVVIEADWDKEQARSSRMRMLALSSEEKFWVAGAHLPFPGLGHVRGTGSGYSWVPAEFSPVEVDSASAP